MDSEENEHTTTETPRIKRRWPGIMFTACIGGIAVISGFKYSISSARQSDPEMFAKGMVTTRQIPGSGSKNLAGIALLYGTAISVGGFACFCLGVWKWSGASNMKEFRESMQKKMPIIPQKPKEEQGRNNFKNLTELFQHVIDLDSDEIEERRRKHLEKYPDAKSE